MCTSEGINPTTNSTKMKNKNEIILETLFVNWVNENSAKIKMLAYLETLTEAEKIALFNEVMT